MDLKNAGLCPKTGATHFWVKHDYSLLQTPVLSFDSQVQRTFSGRAAYFWCLECL